MTKKRYTWFLARRDDRSKNALEICFSSQKKDNLVSQAKYLLHGEGKSMILIRSSCVDGISFVPTFYRPFDETAGLAMQVMRPMVGNVGYELMGAE